MLCRLFTRALLALGGCILAFMVAGSVLGQTATTPANLPAVQRQALAFVADIAPRGQATAEPRKLSYGVNHALLGTFFGDDQVAALVAVDLDHGKDHQPGDNADLCLLLWDHGWKFHQWAGKISATVNSSSQWDWAVKHREGSNAWYVVSHLNFYPAGEHLSWRCDPQTHTLVPTGWPKDSVPSISGETITFTHQDKPGYSSSIQDIYRLTDRLGEHLVTRTGFNVESHQSGNVLILWDADPEKACTWLVHQTILPNYTTRHGLCRSQGSQIPPTFREDAVAEFDWGDHDSHDPIGFLWRRLTGLSDNALAGTWDQDGKPDAKPPARVTVTGLPEAVQRFSWSVNDAVSQ